MLFAIGTKVVLKHTGDRGIITDILDGDMLLVFIETQDMEIPIFEEDLVSEVTYIQIPVISKRNTPSAPIPPPQKIKTYNTSENKNVKEQGLQLAFDPQRNEEDLVEKYQIFLINTTKSEYIFSFQTNIAQQFGKNIHNKIPARATYYLQDLQFDELNDNPSFKLECWQITTLGTGAKQEKQVKIKAKQFFKNVKNAPFLDHAVHLYTLFDNPSNKEVPKPSKEDLKTYTKKNVRPVIYHPSNFKKHKLHDVEEYANFSGEIDLHIENLSSKKGKMSNAEKLRLQLAHFDSFIDKAIRLGVPRVFIIHGLGTGRLRDAIASKLIQIPEVKTFKNEYHPKYGWGATEVIF